MNPLVSIIIPTFNRAHLIGETLDNVLAQTYTNWECIIVDDGSTDNTNLVVTSYVSKDSRFQYHHRPSYKSKGPSACRNYGFELSKGELINWFDDDDVMLPDALQKRISFFKPKVDVVICKLQHYDFDKNVILNETNIIADNPIEDYLVGITTYYISGPIWKREFLLKQKMLFDEGLSNLDDWDFNLRMLYQIPVIKYIEEPLIYYRVHNASLSKEIDKLNINEIKSEFKAREKHVKLLKNNNIVDGIIIRKFIRERYHYFLRESLLNNSKYKWYFFKRLLKKQLSLQDFKGLSKSCFGFVSYSLFKKGYKFIK